MASTPKSKPEAKQKALFRDGYRCCISRAFDSLVMTDAAVQQRARNAGINRNTATACTHIFSESAQEPDKPAEYAASALAILSMFGLRDVAQQLMGGGVNNLSNVITMSTGLHKQFDLFTFWLDEIPGKPNEYKIFSPHALFFEVSDFGPTPSRQVRFEIDPQSLAELSANHSPLPPLPNSQLLALRAACARVAHMSGAAEQIDSISRDMETMGVLAEDGSNFHILEHALGSRVTAY
ncbi:hypothetical protein HGRIS_003238 [Hohenbuehelia grisea]|uniref:HNH nuclease domain-containing protein n=1 Tax=Hohenbuehelia grisea TaxID=104357 RepID=A0ABR3JQ10_9AGAR